ncbi:MAG: AmmeMemoRadiSam system radical SAM enzyme [Candidatus Hinthialibacter antarcticus]|nr:AmmeMemoRadiSam system radical SAM enzyme [Candidatus Hinthialibacter antarcticus]
MQKSESLQTLHHQLSQLTQEGELYERLDGEKLRCFACGHRCLIPDGRPGVCKVRFNKNGRLMVPHGYVAGIQCDPIEKKPFFHALPGSDAMSFGMLGCDLHCGYCQNWLTSQTLRDPSASGRFEPVSPERFVEMALRSGARTVTSTYNEPLITAEWAVEIFRLAKQHGLHTSFVSNGNGTPEVVEYLKPWTDFYKVDLKSFRDKNYRNLGGTLQAVLDTIQLLYASKFWVEIVTLVVPGFNDSENELRDIARFVASVSPTIPWHVTAFHEDYKMQGMGRTQAQTLLRAAHIGKEEGLQFVYIGNLSGQCSEWENTYCPSCETLLIERTGFIVHQNRVVNGCCYSCNAEIPGVWNAG